MGRTLRLWSFAILAPRIIKRYDCDVVVGFGRLLSQDVLRSGGGTHRDFLLRMVQQRGRSRRIWQFLSLYHRSLLQIEKRQFSDRRLMRVIAVSDEVRRDIESNYRIARDKISVLYNGVDQKRFHPSRRATMGDDVRARWHVPHEAHLVLFVGSGFLRKGLDRLIAIWNRPRLSQVYLMVAGDDGRMGYYKNWARSVAGNRIIFVGRQDDIENYYASADLVALPAVQEAFGNVVLESLATGVPVVVSREVGAGAILTGCLRRGVIENADNPDQLEAGISLMLEECQKPNFRTAARQLGEDYSWKRHFQRLEAILEEVAHGSGPTRAS